MGQQAASRTPQQKRFGLTSIESSKDGFNVTANYLIRKDGVVLGFTGHCEAVQLLNDADALRTENERLRAALQYVAEGGEDWKDCARHARAALA